jgi:hypothetical protein
MIRAWSESSACMPGWVPAGGVIYFGSLDHRVYALRA